MADKERRRERHELRRRKRRREARANLAAAQPDADAAKRAAWHKRLRRRRLAYAFMAAGAFVALSHVFEHAGAFQVFPNASLQDLLIGFPAAAVLFIVGLVMLPAERF